MLDRLRAKQGAAGVTNITTVEADWEEADSAPHDVVLAAWALYRQVDLGAALTRLIAATRRLLVIAVSDSADPPQRAHVRAIWGGDGEPDIPVPLYLLGALRQLGVAANLQMVPETRAFLGPTPADIARRLAPLAASADEVPDLALRLRPQIEERPEGHRSAFTVPAALMTWQRRSRQQAREQRARPGE